MELKLAIQFDFYSQHQKIQRIAEILVAELRADYPIKIDIVPKK